MYETKRDSEAEGVSSEDCTAGGVIGEMSGIGGSDVGGDVTYNDIGGDNIGGVNSGEVWTG